MTQEIIVEKLRQLRVPPTHSHKGQNGKLLLIGGSELFHAASRWSLDVAACLVDMVFYASVPSNNKLITEAKGKFWNGIVIAREEVDSYAQEADCILIGPGMERNTETKEFVDSFVKKVISASPEKRLVVDAGALQLIDPALLTPHTIITPHHQEIVRFIDLLKTNKGTFDTTISPEFLQSLSAHLGGPLILLKGATDVLATPKWNLSIPGGTPGLTKGGTGDVLAGLIAALYCTNDALSAAIVGSYCNKRAAEVLSQKLGPYFSTTLLAESIPKILWRELLAANNPTAKAYPAAKSTTTTSLP